MLPFFLWTNKVYLCIHSYSPEAHCVSLSSNKCAEYIVFLAKHLQSWFFFFFVPVLFTSVHTYSSSFLLPWLCWSVESLCAHAQDKLSRDPLIEKLFHGTTGGQKLQRGPLTWKVWAVEVVRFKNIQEVNVDIKLYSTAENWQKFCRAQMIKIGMVIQSGFVQVSLVSKVCKKASMNDRVWFRLKETFTKVKSWQLSHSEQS